MKAFLIKVWSWVAAAGARIKAAWAFLVDFVAWVKERGKTE